MGLNENLKTFLFIISIIVVLLIGFYYYFNWIYEVELTMTPCQLCAKLNPDLKECLTVQKDFRGNIISQNYPVININFSK